MFGKYFKHVLVLTLLAGSAYSLPQVKEGMVGAFGFEGLNEALLINYNGSTSAQINTSINRSEIKPVVMQAQKSEQYIIQQEAKRQIPPEEIVAILYKAGVIPDNKLATAVKVLKEHMPNRTAENASSTRPLPLDASSTPMGLGEGDARELIKFNASTTRATSTRQVRKEASLRPTRAPITGTSTQSAGSTDSTQ